MAPRTSETAQSATLLHALPNRRQFLEMSSAAALSAIALRSFGVDLAAAELPFNPTLLPTIDEIWKTMEAMAQEGPRYAGNTAHRRFVDSLDADMKAAGLQVTRDSYTFPRWEAKKWRLSATPKGGRPVDLPVTFYYPHSGQTGPTGVSGPLAYAGKMASNGSSKVDLSGDLKGKVVFIDYEISARDYNEWYEPWGYYTPDTVPKMDKYVSSVMAQPFEDLSGYKKAGAAAVIIGWSNLSDGQAKGQNWPFGRPLADIPSLLVGRETGAKLRLMAAEGGTATVVLEADVVPNAGTDALVATLPGTSSDEVVIVNTHTDGPNVIQENAGIVLVALARYFAKLPKGNRRRTLVFSQNTGHDIGAYVPGKQGSFIERHPDVVKKAVASVAIEHLGCREWRDDESHARYAATGQDELTYAITNHEPLARLELDAVKGTTERRVAAVKTRPNGRYLGVGGALARTGMPTLGYYASPTYLNIEAPDGCISKLSKTLFYGQLISLTKLLLKIDATSAADIKGRTASSQG